MKSIYSSIMLLLFVIFTTPAMAQSTLFTVHGKVTSFEESVALEGVTIKVKGTSSITGTQADGTFSIDVTGTKQVLVVELAEYETQEITVGNERDFDITLKGKTSTAQNQSLTGSGTPLYAGLVNSKYGFAAYPVTSR